MWEEAGEYLKLGLENFTLPWLELKSLIPRCGNVESK